jgi:N-methylhydantoinase A
MLMTDVRQDLVLTRIARLDTLSPQAVSDTFRALQSKGAADLAKEGLAPETFGFLLSCDMRYVGQAYEINIALRGAASEADACEPAVLVKAFHAEHKRLYGQCSEREPVEIVSYRVGAISAVGKATLSSVPPRDHGTLQPRTHRRILLDRKVGWILVPVFERSRLTIQDTVVGPAVIEDGGSSFVLRTGHDLSVDRFGNIFVLVRSTPNAQREVA